ncbi:hypothetical protein ACPCA8_28670 [Streptomyces capoamus]|uniref:hypothetical protein n=1 Tax=Streptomyces capoamus TaxID=68183 RepID=UPI003C2B2207
MAEHDSDREGREERDGRGERDGHEAGEPDERQVPFDEDAAWRAIVAGYGEEPPDPPGARPFKPVEDLALPEPEKQPARTPVTEPAKEPVPEPDGDAGGDAEDPAGRPPARPLGGSVSFAPGVGPRDHTVAEPSDDDFDEDDEGHFVPPEPPPLPTADTTARFAWLGVTGGPVLLLLAVLLGWDMTWWLATAGIGGFLGGFATLVARMRTDDEEDDDPGRGAVV